MVSPFERAVRRVAAAGACVLVLSVLVGCTNDSDRPRPAPSQPPAPTAAAPTLEPRPVPLQVRVTRVHGRLAKADQALLERNIGRTVGAYFDDAYLGGRYPRDEFRSSFATFTSGAARQAAHDRSLLTHAVLGASTHAVVPEQKRAWLSVLAPNRVAAGVTARIQLVYLADRGEAQDQRVTVTGRLLLTRKKAGEWQIFGYDVARAAGPAENGAP